MDITDSRRMNDEGNERSHINNNNIAVERSILAVVCGPIRRILDIFLNLFRNACTGLTDGRITRSFCRWIRNSFFRFSRSDSYQVNDFPRLTLPKIPIKRQYNMSHDKRGIALIFNQNEFDAKTGFGNREGTDVDLDTLINTLEKLEFEVMYFSDLLLDDITKKLEKVSLMDHSEMDCILIAILTHGLNNEIFSRNESYHISFITSFFTDENCPSLKGKPKLFFIQACRGKRIDFGHIIKTTSSDHLRRIDMGTFEQIDVTKFNVFETFMEVPEMVHNPPNHPDFLIVRSTMPDYVSFRNTKYGSWFIQDLCQELDENGNNTDILTLLTYVNFKVSRRESSHVQKGKQILCISSMLTRQLIFHPKTRVDGTIKSYSVE